MYRGLCAWSPSTLRSSLRHTVSTDSLTTIPGQTTAPTIPLPTLAPDSTVAPAPETTGSP